MIGGKMKLSESIQECALREAKEETGLDVSFKEVKAVIHERVRDEGVFKHSFVIFFTHLEPQSESLTSTEEGQLDWFDIKDIENIKIIPSDKWMVEEFLLNNKKGTHSIIMDEKDEQLISLHTEEH